MAEEKRHEHDSRAEVKQLVHAFFGRYAEHYAESHSHREGADLDRLITLLQPMPAERVLDVATGAGHTALRLAEHVGSVVGLDYTPAMRVPFERLARGRGLRNVRFQVGDAELLPFPDATFDIVTCRRASHHFPRVDQAVSEMARVLRPGGRLGIADMTALDEAVAGLLNALEIARDSSHVRACTPAEWRHLVEQAGLEILTLEIEVEPIPWERWLSPRPPDGPEAAAAERALGEAPPEVARHIVEQRPEGRYFIKRRVVLVARK